MTSAGVNENLASAPPPTTRSSGSKRRLIHNLPREVSTMNETAEDRTLSLIAQGILDASDEEILATARASGVDVAALQDHVRRLVDARDRSAAAPRGNVEPGPFAVGQPVALRSDPTRVGIVHEGGSDQSGDPLRRLHRLPRRDVADSAEGQLVALDRAAAGPTHADEYKARLTALQPPRRA